MFLSLDGTEVQCTKSSRTAARIGSTGAAFAGERASTTRALKREWSLSSVPLAAADLATLRGLLDGNERTAAGDFDATGATVRGQVERVRIQRLAAGLHWQVDFTLKEI